MAGALLILVGPSGAGKDTFTEMLMRETRFKRFPSATTRPKRAEETPSSSYTFMSDDEFQRLLNSGELLYDLDVAGYRYSIQRSILQTAGDHHFVLHLVEEWALKIKALYPQSMLVLLQLPSVDEQVRRLKDRGSTHEDIEKRLSGSDQTPSATSYDLVLMNETDQIDGTFLQLLEFIRQTVDI